jgi:pimeloyl-[acyl-carrier protein] methyl ester esterase
MTPLLVLVHGWGYDASFWRPLIEALPDAECLAWDLGYYGEPALPPPGREAVAVGHSHGVLWLLRQRPFAWHGLVSINGFSRFSAAPDLPQGVPLAQVDRLGATLEADPSACLAGFRQRCGDMTPPPSTPNVSRLLDSLEHLRQWDERPALPGLALCGETDKVVPAPLSRALFPEGITRWHAGGHLLPQQDPDWCAGEIRTWLKRA